MKPTPEEILVALTATPRRTALRAGPWALNFEEGDLRTIRFGPHEAVRRIYAAVRDENWDTIRAEISDLSIRVEDGGFEIRYVATHARLGIGFEWEARITGDARGVIRFSFDGEARTTFRRNRIGLCVLHPMECAGSRCRVERVDGSRAELRFPVSVDPAQPVPGICDLRKFAHELGGGAWAELEFEGERFEMEDQRNWIDASFKTYGTPLCLPLPVEVVAGTRIRQVVTLRILDGALEPGAVEVVEEGPVEIIVGTETRPLPAIGLGMASHGESLSESEIERLRQLLLWHLRVDLRLDQESWPDQLRRAATEAGQLDLPIELVVHLPERGGDAELRQLAGLLRIGAIRLERVLVVSAGRPSTGAEALARAREHLGWLRVPHGAGTDGDFYQLNQFRPPWPEADFVFWSMNPQVHARDITSLTETPAAIAAQLHSARVYFPGKPLVVSPVTLRPRFNPVARSAEPVRDPRQLPPSVDPRQPTPYAATWTLAAIKHLAEGGAESITLFETTGCRGVMEREQGDASLVSFHSRPGQVFPLYHVLGEITGFGGGEVVVTQSSAPQCVEAITLTKKGWVCTLLANFTAEPQRVRLSGIRRVTHVRIEDWSLPAVWMFAPMVTIGELGTERPADGADVHEVRLPPFALMRLELDR